MVLRMNVSWRARTRQCEIRLLMFFAFNALSFYVHQHTDHVHLTYFTALREVIFEKWIPREDPTFIMAHLSKIPY